ncbi:MAG: response regulator transcription factor [Alphaproteobacteria bacterium]|nr:response regulator transcription factor [Alphaproteobacteria bacterium]
MVDDATIFILDDDAAVRDSLSMLIESTGFTPEAFASCREFLARAPFPPRACLLLDVHMPEMSGLQLQDELARRGIKLPVIVMTGQADVPVAVRAMKAGALDFIEKPFSDEIMLDSVRRALAAPAAQPAGDPVITKRMAELTPREHDVLLQMVAGNPNKVTAYNLGISPRTVEIHRARVMEKMAARSLSELVRMALAAGIDPAK